MTQDEQDNMAIYNLKGMKRAVNKGRIRTMTINYDNKNRTKKKNGKCKTQTIREYLIVLGGLCLILFRKNYEHLY